MIGSSFPLPLLLLALVGLAIGGGIFNYVDDNKYVVEDLGADLADLYVLRDKYNLKGMKIFEYCYDFKEFKDNGHEFLLTFTWDEYIRMPLNLETKYYSKEMARKYENKEKKSTNNNRQEIERKAYCTLCGKEMSVYDADIMRANGEEPICKECLEKALKK